MGGVILFSAPRYCERAIKLGVTKMDARIVELMERVARLEAAMVQRADDEELVHMLQHKVVGYEAWLEALRTRREIVEHHG